MRKRKELSRRKKVKFIHDIKNLSYKESRELLKANGYDIYKALGIKLDIGKVIAEGVTRAIDEITEAYKTLAGSMVTFIKEVIKYE